MIITELVSNIDLFKEEKISLTMIGVKSYHIGQD